MTQVYICCNGRWNEIRIQGHAGYAKEGEDIVCAAVSTLSYTLMQCLRDAEDAGIIRGLSQSIESGDIRASYESIHHGTAHTILNTILCGFRMIEEQYPSHCRVVLVDHGLGEK